MISCVENLNSVLYTIVMKRPYKVCKCGFKSYSPERDFYKQKQTADGLHSQCKTCVDAYQAKYYQNNKKKLQKKNRKVRLVLKRKRQLFVLRYLKEHPCIDCGETDPICLDFDHVRGKKLGGISEMIQNTYSENNLLKEIEKCDVRCSNCHRKKTAIQYDWYDYIDFDTMTITNFTAKPKPRKRHLLS